MGKFTTEPYAASDGAEYADYLQHILAESERLQRDGRLPDNEAVLMCFDSARVVMQQVRRDVTAAVARGEKTVVSTLAMTPAEHERMESMGESIGNLLEILELRKAVERRRTEGAGRVAAAVRDATYTS